MRRFFRFSIRDLLWLTLVVALSLGWFVRERQHNNDFLDWNAAQEAAIERATEWRQAARAMEHVLNQDGWEVSLNFGSSEAWVWRKKPDDGYKNERRYRFPLYLMSSPADE